ncbi:predicted protein [Candida tropicalis MYA-3404]|uniref:UEV domain-containing protein n=1 Tax=Candida tropicalis (strain ATCC MYA-3404 / T1) TaxID=294747 RepID=C5MCW1_CANTT|nr:predicted protein [Candida tropicalis MYA-3404]EER32391.1 predicted protein [Candida tropicalis MYA-3404]KAG4406000.1 hypothetical protein JTP64_004871 [Candida tropicalis]
MSDPIPQSVSNWLFNVIQPLYDNKQIVYTHVYQFLQVHLKKNLNFKVRTRVYTSSGSGQSNLLINLFGTIAINNEISVPVEIWVPTSYPFVDQAGNGTPLVYIVPDHNRNWYLRPSNNVDTQGMFYHPYMSSWYKECKKVNQSSLNRYNLVELLNVVYQSVTTNCPIVSEQPIPSNLPPKPAKIAINSPDATPAPILPSVPTQSPVSMSFSGENQNQPGRLQPETTGPPLPAKPPKLQSPPSQNYSNTPLKYQSPLPLPDERNNMQIPFSYPVDRTSSPLHPTGFDKPPSRTEDKCDVILQNRSTVSPSTTIQAPVDLMDNENSVTSTGNLQRKQMLDQLAININKCLVDDEINQDIRGTNENIMKIEALYNQLDHHLQQAQGNSRNLDDHINYLSTQLTNLTNLNRDLSQLDEKNSHDKSNVSINPLTTISLDDLIIPDSPLTKQLYEITSEIKAIKDTINLITGSFHNQQETINDDRFDTCVKMVRNMGRDLFWLELTKEEISKKIMNLS